jgi:hypothetical protein
MSKREHDGEDGDPLRSAVDELIRKVPHRALRTVIDEIELAAVPGDRRANTLRIAFVEHFNRLRPMKARRLFTSLFEPLLIDDPVLYRSHRPVPGLVQRVDVGGLWAGLERFAFPKLAAEVQATLDALSRHDVLDDVLAGSEALAMRAAMCREAAGFLAGLPRNNKLADSFLVAANRAALAAARERSPHLTAKTPIDLGTLEFFRSVLEESDALLPALVRMLAEIPAESPEGDAKESALDTQAALLVSHGREMRGLCPQRSPLEPVLWISPLCALNLKRRHDVVQRYLREFAAPTSQDAHPLHLAVFAHFTGCVGTLIDLTHAVSGVAEANGGESLAMPRPVRDLLDQAINRLDVTMRTLSASGLMSNRIIGPRIRPMLTDLTGALVERMMPLCLERAIQAFTARNYPEPDHEDIVWLLDRIWAWSATLGRVGYATPEAQRLRQRLREVGQEAFLSAIRPEPEDIPEKRLTHVVRINQLLAAIGESVGPWISPVSQGLQKMIRQELEFGSERAPEVSDVIARYIAAVRSELGRSRNWQSTELVGLLKLYEERTA